MMGERRGTDGLVDQGIQRCKTEPRDHGVAGLGDSALRDGVPAPGPRTRRIFELLAGRQYRVTPGGVASHLSAVGQETDQHQRMHHGPYRRFAVTVRYSHGITPSARNRSPSAAMSASRAATFSTSSAMKR